MFEPLRWVTIHPALVHLPIGIVPLMLLAYGLGMLRKSPQWTFAGDVALGVSAIGTGFAVAFGALAYVRLYWTASLNRWAILHLALGSATFVALVGLAFWRWRSRTGRPVAGLPATLAAAGLTLFVLATGYVGGEMLVYTAGAAVTAAGDGALSPSILLPANPPTDVLNAMDHLKPAWASATTALAESLVTRPSDERFARIESDARTMQRLARWLVDWGNTSEHQGAAPQGPGVGGSGGSGQHGESMVELAGPLVQQAADLEKAAGEKDLPRISEALGAVTRQCSECHLQKRWKSEDGGDSD